VNGEIVPERRIPVIMQAQYSGLTTMEQYLRITPLSPKEGWQKFIHTGIGTSRELQLTHSRAQFGFMNTVQKEEMSLIK